MRPIAKLSGALLGTLALTGAMLSLTLAAELKSGVDKGGMLSAYHPRHVSGPDKNTDTCPVCKYPTNPAVQVWVNTDDVKNVAAIAETLEKTARANADKKFKAFVVFMNPNKETPEAIEKQLQAMAKKDKLERVTLAYLSGPDDDAVKEYEINTAPQVKNTVFVYRNRKVETKFINLVADKKGQEALTSALQTVLKQGS